MKYIMGVSGFFLLYFLIDIGIVGVNSIPWPFGSWGQNENNWTGPWFPYEPGTTADRNPIVELKSKAQVHDNRHGIQMGVPTYDCDDGKSRLERDWDNSPINYTCYGDKTLYLPRSDVSPIFSQDYIPPYYAAMHKCMGTTITYDVDVPTFGAHRPLWPKYGEYKFLPKQRWLHNLEHGAVAMLYHPCASSIEVDFLRRLVTKCLARHVITPYTLLTPERPLALVTWGHRLLMSEVDPDVVTAFIKTHAKHGPEQLYHNGQYDHGLIRPAGLVTDKYDSKLCATNAAQIMA